MNNEHKTREGPLGQPRTAVDTIADLLAQLNTDKKLEASTLIRHHKSLLAQQVKQRNENRNGSNEIKPVTR